MLGLGRYIWGQRKQRVLELLDIHTYYGESHVLHGVSLQVEDGSVVAILGRNGMGKTTTVHSIIGFTPPRRGEVRFKGTNITAFPPHQIARMGVGLVPQGKRIFASLTVKENLTVAARSSAKGDGWSLEKVFEIFPILNERANKKATSLSGGEQQMLSIGRALMTNPELLIMDEPSEGLAPLIVREIGRIIRELKRSGLSILLVEQNLRLALDVSDSVYVLSKGVMAYHCTPDELRGNEEVQAKYLAVAE